MVAEPLFYRGYYGIITGREKGMIHGCIDNINELVTFEARSERTLEKEFRIAVEAYLETCEILGKEPADGI